MIKEFQGEYRWLSNFAPVPVELNGVIYPSVEHAYMSAKSLDPSWKAICANPDIKAGDIKRRSRNLKLVKNWNDIKLNVMSVLITRKFMQEPFKTMLLSTGNQHIQEGNKWRDKFWGVCLITNEGENHLGRLIMAVRDSLRIGIEA